MTYHLDFSFVASSWRLLLIGLLGTFKIAIVALGCGLAIGLFVGMGRLSRRWWLRWPAGAYVELLRNTPVLVQLMIVFYVLPILTGLQTDPFTAAVLTLSLYTASYAAEIFRSGIASIERGQWEASKALGFGYWQQMRYVVLPQAVKRMIPAFTNRTIELVKATALASLIAYGELLYQGKYIASVNYQPVEGYTAVSLIFTAVLLPLSYLAVRLERRLGRSD